MRFKDARHSVVLAAADTFRAAAIDQLQIWADRAGVDLVKHGEGSDPAAVVFDATASAKLPGMDADTAVFINFTLLAEKVYTTDEFVNEMRQR